MPDVKSVKPGVWDFDPAHSQVGFVARHMVVSKVRGQFQKFQGSVTIAEKPEDSRVEATLEVSSLTTHDEKRDGHLLSADFFDAEKNPTITFKSTSVTVGSDGELTVLGDLSIKGVSKPVTLDGRLLGVGAGPWGKDIASFEASTQINRDDWGLSWNVPLADGNVLVSQKIRIEIEVEATPHVTEEAAAAAAAAAGSSASA